MVTDEHGAAPQSDPIAPLLERIRTTATRESVARELLREVHRAVYPLCLEMLGDPDDAYEAEAETISRLMARVGRDDYATAPIDNGTAYVRQIARNISRDMRRRAAPYHDRPLDDLHDREMPAVADHAATMHSPVTTPLLADRDLASTFGYTSSRALADLGCLSDQERRVVILRQEGYSYIQIAALLGHGLSPQTAQTQGERGLQKLRGLVHVGVWRQQPPTKWTTPPCPELAQLKTQVQQHLTAGTTITAGLYLQIGRHLNPDPNRRPGQARAPRCELCDPERERSRREYWWLLILLLPFPAVATRPTLRLTAAPAGAVPAAVLQPGPPVNPAPAPRGGHKNRTRWAVAAALLLLFLFAAGAALRPGHAQRQADQGPAQVRSSDLATQPPTSAAPSRGDAGATSTPPVPPPQPTTPKPPRTKPPQTKPPQTKKPPPIQGTTPQLSSSPSEQQSLLQVTVAPLCDELSCYGDVAVWVDDTVVGHCNTGDIGDDPVITCEWNLPTGTVVTIDGYGQQVDSWEDDCAGTSPDDPCVLTLDGDRYVYVNTGYAGPVDPGGG